MPTVPFLDVAATARWIADRKPERLIGDVTDALQRDFARWPELETRPRLASHSPDGVIELMPAADRDTFGFKLVNGHPRNPSRGFQTVTACGMLVAVDNGYPVFLAEMTLLTALRTAATAALAARYLAPTPRTGVHALIGTGCQSEFQALAMRGECGLSTVAVYDVDPCAMRKFEANATKLGFTVELHDSAASAVARADVITTCTADKRNATVLFDPEVAGARYISAIGGDCPGKTELDPAILARADLVVVEHEAQARIEGEIQLQSPDFPVTELWRIIRGEAPGRAAGPRGEDELIIFDSVGFGVEDLSILMFVRDELAATGGLEQLDLIANPADPKNLFSLVQ